MIIRVIGLVLIALSWVPQVVHIPGEALASDTKIVNPEKENLTLAQLCRRKLKEKSPAKIEFILENLNHKLNKILENGTK